MSRIKTKELIKLIKTNNLSRLENTFSDKALIDILIKSQDKRDKTDYSPLMFALLYSNFDAFHHLKKLGANINKQNTNNESIVFLALLFLKYIKKSFKRKGDRFYSYLKNMDLDKAEKNVLSIIDALLVSDIELSSNSSDSNNVFYQAIELKSKKYSDALINMGIGINSLSNDQLGTSLLELIKEYDYDSEYFDYFFDLCGDRLKDLDSEVLSDLLYRLISSDEKRDSSKYKHVLINMGVKLSLEKSSSAFDWTINTKDDTELFRRLIKCTDPSSLNRCVIDSDFRTPLMSSINEEKMEFVELLLNTKCDINWTNKYEESAIIYAIQKMNVELVKLLLSKGAKPVNLCYAFPDKNSDEKEMKVTNIIEALVEKGADVNDTFGTTINFGGRYLGRDITIGSLIEGKPNQISVPISLTGLDNLANTTPLMWSVRMGYKKISQYLIEQGADVNAVTYNGWTPLMLSVIDQNSDITEILLKNGANATLYNSFGATALKLSKYCELSANTNGSTSILKKYMEK